MAAPAASALRHGAYRQSPEIYLARWYKAVGRSSGINIGRRTAVVDNQSHFKTRLANFFFGAEVCFVAWMIVGWPLWSLISSWMQ